MKQHETPVTVRFNEVDAFNVVWHGHYIGYFELGRLDLCGRYKLSPDDLKDLGLFAPVVTMTCRLRGSAKYPDSLLVKTSVVPSEKAMLTFSFQLYRLPDMRLLAEGETAHVLLTLGGKMLYEIPAAVAERIATMMAYLNEE